MPQFENLNQNRFLQFLEAGSATELKDLIHQIRHPIERVAMFPFEGKIQFWFLSDIEIQVIKKETENG